MGINGLFDIIRDLYPHLIKKVLLQNIACGKNIAIDIASPLYKYKSTQGEQWMNGVISLVCYLKKYNIQAVFVFDGPPPALKDREKERRNNTKQGMDIKVKEIENDLDLFIKSGKKSVLLLKTLKNIKTRARRSKTRRLLKKPSKDEDDDSSEIDEKDIKLIRKKIEKMSLQIVRITKEDIKIVKDFFDVAGVSYLQSSTEAETLCSYLVNQGICSIGVTEDSDMIVYGTENSVFKLDPTTGHCDLIVYSELLEAFKMNREEFRDFCIMCGTDYNDRIPKIGPKKSLKLLEKYRSLEKMEEIDRREGIKDGKMTVSFKNLSGYEAVREIFDHTEIPKAKIGEELVEVTNFECWKPVNVKKIVSYVAEMGSWPWVMKRVEESWKESEKNLFEIVLID